MRATRHAACRYEVTLGTCGIQQVGWATVRCRFTEQKGAGDTMNSYAFDGKRKRKWNGTEEEYGLHWSGGDVVGVRIDLNAREVCACACVWRAPIATSA